ncbi:MAG: hypothetical protein ABH950_08455 [Candidatus Altiarchaeota archaeon]
MGTLETLEQVIGNLTENSIVLFTVSPARYSEFNEQLLHYLSVSEGLNGIYVTFNKPRDELVEEFEAAGIPTDKFFFVDCVTRMVGGNTSAKRTIYVGSPKDLTGIAVSISNAITQLPKDEKAFLFLDSLSTISIYNNAGSVAKFSHFMYGKIKMFKLKGIIMSVEKTLNKAVLDAITQFCDQIVDVEKLEEKVQEKVEVPEAKAEESVAKSGVPRSEAQEKSQVLDAHPLIVSSLAADERQLYTASPSDNSIKVWDKQKRTLLKMIDDYCCETNGLALDEKFIYAITGPNKITLWDKWAWVCYKETTADGLQAPIAVDKDYLYSGADDNSIKVWRKTDLKLVGRLKGHTKPITSLAVDQLALYSAQGDMLVIWNKAKKKLVSRSHSRTNSIESIALDQTHIYLCFASGVVAQAGKINVNQPQPMKIQRKIKIAAKATNSVAADQDNLYVGTQDGQVKIVELKQEK